MDKDQKDFDEMNDMVNGAIKGSTTPGTTPGLRPGTHSGIRDSQYTRDMQRTYGDEEKK